MSARCPSHLGVLTTGTLAESLRASSGWSAPPSGADRAALCVLQPLWPHPEWVSQGGKAGFRPRPGFMSRLAKPSLSKRSIQRYIVSSARGTNRPILATWAGVSPAAIFSKAAARSRLYGFGSLRTMLSSWSHWSSVSNSVRTSLLLLPRSALTRALHSPPLLPYYFVKVHQGGPRPECKWSGLQAGVLAQQFSRSLSRPGRRSPCPA
jgi:hypothetical protein